MRILSDLISINWSKSNTMVFSKEYTQCKVDRGQGCTVKASEGDSIPRGKEKNGMERRIGMAAAAGGAPTEPGLGTKS